MNLEFKDYLLSVTGAISCAEVEVIQSLWSGYGQIARYQLQDSQFKTVVVKHIALDHANDHPKGWKTDIGHRRKVHSYEVEMVWYADWNKRCSETCRTAKCLGSLSLGDEHWIILEDLDAQFPLRKQQLELPEVKACLRWLANFHAKFMNRQPKGLWEVGTYWHLATRPEEWERMTHKELKRKAHQIDTRLNTSEYKTIVHGDAKVANFCFSEDGQEVAAVDFQYVGGGCGMKDVAYFLGSCLSNEQLFRHTDSLLDHYFHELQKALLSTNYTLSIAELEQEWRSLFPIAWTDFTRFLLGWMPTHEKVNNYSVKLMDSVLSDLE